MLPEHHLPQLIPGRIQAAVGRLQSQIWSDRMPVWIEASESRPDQMPLKEAKKLKRSRVEHCSFWGRLFDQRWCRVTLPVAADGNTWLQWRDQAEATLYIKDQPYFGFNVAHRFCRLPSGTKEVWVQSSCVQSAIWHGEANGMDEKGSYFEGAWIVRRNDETWEAYHDLKCLFDLAMDTRNRENPQVPITIKGSGQQEPVDKFTPAYRRMLRVMNEAVDALDSQGVGVFRKQIAQAYRELRSDKNFSSCVLTGHAHLDLVWIWPERIGEIKAVNIFATVDRLMDEYPEYRFAYSQPASYEAVKRREPGFYKKVLQRIRSKKWEATGAMYVESDTIFACGEALARSFIIGQQGFREINGKPSCLTWLPDVFGYSACLPQIMKQTGVDYFFTTKMTWNAINRFPHSSFIWRGHDGSEVLAHVTQESGYVTHMGINDVKAPMHANQQADLYKEYLLPTGYGDGGGGPTDEMIERARRLGSLPGMPEIKWGQPEAFFRRLESVAPRLPLHQGECYLEYHRGTYTTHGNLKWTFRNLERALQVSEAVSAVTGKRWDMTHAWKRQIFAQFHDYIPGSSVWDVYVEGLPELKTQADEQQAKAQAALKGKGSACLFNPHAVEVRKWIRKPRGGKPVHVALPPASGIALDKAVVASTDTVKISGKSVSNGSTSFRINASGWVDQLTWEGVAVPLKSALGQLLLYPDRATNFEPWDIDRHVLSMGQVCKSPAKIIPVQDGYRAGFSVKRAIGKKSEATVSFLLEAGSPLVHIEIELDWQEPEHLLKIHFPTRYAATHARFGIAYGSVLRSQVSNGPVAEAMWEVPFSRHLEVFDEGEAEGLFIASESKYGASVRNGEVGVSLVRSPRVTGFDAHAHAWPPHLSRLKNISPYSDLGKHSIRLAIGRYDIGLPRERQPASVAETLFTDPVAYVGREYPSAIKTMEGGESLVPCWIKPAEKGKGWILRLHEVAGKRGEMKLKLQPGWKMESTDLGESFFKPCNGRIRFTPYQVISLRLQASA